VKKRVFQQTPSDSWALGLTTTVPSDGPAAGPILLTLTRGVLPFSVCAG
jgi:hypothetical protein